MTSLAERVNERVHHQKIPDVAWIEQMWIPALESDTYQQTRNRLHDDQGYCCLGVACELIPGVTWSKETSYHDGYVVILNGQTLNEDVEVPKRFRSQIGMGGNWIDLPPGRTLGDVLDANQMKVMGLRDDVRHLPVALMNDTGSSFREIAAALRTLVALWRAWADEERDSARSAVAEVQAAARRYMQDQS